MISGMILQVQMCVCVISLGFRYFSHVSMVQVRGEDETPMAGEKPQGFGKLIVCEVETHHLGRVR